MRMEDQLRELLRDLAEEAPSQDRMPPGLVGRARRRIALVATAAVVGAAAILAGSALAVRAVAFSHPTVPASPRPTAATPVQPTPSTSPSPSGSPSSAPTPLCSDTTARATMLSTNGAMGTLTADWQVTNTAATACHTDGYPGMDFHASSGWLSVHVIRGVGVSPYAGVKPKRIVLLPGQSVHFINEWHDIGSNGTCTQFDRVRITLPDNQTSIEVPFTGYGCLDPTNVSVSPVIAMPSTKAADAAACDPNVILQAILRDPELGALPQYGSTRVFFDRVQILACQNGYAFVTAFINNTTPTPGTHLDGSDPVILKDTNGTWGVLTSGSGVSCSAPIEPSEPAPVRDACVALGLASPAP